MHILVNKRQQGNPILKHMRNVPCSIDAAILPDYIMGQQICGLYLSLRYHLLHPRYLFTRLDECRGMYSVRILLVQVDVEDNQSALNVLSQIAVVNKWTIICAWSYREAARYLESYCVLQQNTAKVIQERVEDNAESQITAFLKSIRSVNKSDVAALLQRFGSLRGIAAASVDALAACPGIGPKKALYIHTVLHTPFN